MDQLPRAIVRVLAATVFLVLITWTNLTGLGVGSTEFTYDSVALPRFVVAIVGTAVAWTLLAALLRKGGTFVWDVTLLLLAALAVWATVSGALAGSPLVWLGQSERLEGVATVALYAAVFGAGLQVGRSERSVRSFALAVAVGAAVLSVHGILQFARIDPSDYTVSGAGIYYGSAFASLGNPNFLAGLLVLSLPLTMASALAAESRAWRAAGWTAALASLFALYATYSQAAWLALLVEAAVALGLWLVRRGRSKRHVIRGAGWRASSLIALVALAVVAVGVVVILTVSATAAERGARLWGEGIPESVAARLEIVTSTASIVADHPVMGIGPDNYLEGFRLHRTDAYVEVYGPRMTNNNAHNWVLQYAATLGVPGALLLGAALVTGLVRSRPRLSAATPDRGEPLRIAAWLGCIGFAVQMMFNVATLASSVPFWLLLGALGAPHARRRTLPDAARPVASAVSVAALVLAIGVSTAAIAADATFMASRSAFHSGDAIGAARLAERAAAINPFSVKYSRGVADARVAQALSAISGGDTAEADVRRLYAEAALAARRTLERWPNDYASLAWLAAVQSAAGSYLDDAALLAEGRASAERAATLDRHHDEVAGIVAGDVTPLAVFSARAVPPLP